MTENPHSNLVGMDARAAGLMMAAGVVSAAELATASLERIERVDQRDGGTRAVLEANPEALQDARRRDAERAAGDLRGPLHGVPVLIKDNIDTAGPMHTTAGSLALAGTRPTADAPLVQRLRDAGAVILGKANLSEWANYRSTGSTSGWSAAGGLTRNPWSLDRSAGGSSSGSAAAIAARLAPLSVGTETDGSIICPASFCGVVGVKPTVGLVPTQGVIPIAHSQDSVGPMARTVRDAAVLLAVLTGTAPDAYLEPTQSSAPSLRGVRLGLPRQLWTKDAALAQAIDDAVAVLGRAGATIVDDVRIPSVGTVDGADELIVLDHELKAGLAAYLATRGGGPRTLADLIAFNAAHADVELVHFDQDIFERADRTAGLDAIAYLEARQRCLEAARTNGIDAVLSEHRLDALVMPSPGPAWLIDLEHGDGGPPPQQGSESADPDEVGCTTLSAMAGYPIITVPCGRSEGLPLGVAFAGTAGSDASLLRIADAYEVTAYGPEGATAALGEPTG